MNLMVYLIFLIVSFGASIAGAICGIGGGVIIKLGVGCGWRPGCGDHQFSVWMYGADHELLFCL
ncbi:MAG: hypothetical protein V8S98_08150 [Lachnospiraceae bacterium]